VGSKKNAKILKNKLKWPPWCAQLDCSSCPRRPLKSNRLLSTTFSLPQLLTKENIAIMKAENNKLKIALYPNINLILLGKAKIMNSNFKSVFTVRILLIVSSLTLVAIGGVFLYFFYLQPHPQVPPYRPELQVCKEDSDCAVAIRLSACCGCPKVFSKDQIKKDKNLVIYEEGKNYSSRPPLSCRGVMCQPCKPILGAVCSNNRCQEPQKWDEILRVCSNCYTAAALAAYRDDNLPEAIQFCKLDSNKDQCFFSIIREAIFKNKITDASRLCREEVKENQATCLQEIAQAVAKTDLQDGLKICREIRVDSLERDNCFHNLAVTAKEKGDTSQALNICRMMSSHVEECKDLINRYCDIYPLRPECLK
jgi:hypothetical protein